MEGDGDLAMRDSTIDRRRPEATAATAAAAHALDRAIACPNRNPEIEAALLAADVDDVEAMTRVRLRNAYVWQRHLAGDTKTPIALLERTVAELRGRRDTAEGLALCGLAAAYANQERTAEAIVTASRSVRIFEACDAPTEAVRARVMLIAAFVACEAWCLADRVGVPIQRDLRRIDPRVVRWTEKHLLMYAMDEAAAAGSGLASLVVIDALETFLGDEASSDEFKAVLPMNRAMVLVRAGRMDEAFELADRALATEPRMPAVRSQLRLIRARCLANRGVLAEARTEAIGSVDELRGPTSDASSARLRSAAAAAGALLLNEVGDASAADEMFELASSAVVARLREIEHAFSNIPEFRDASPDDLALVAECREHACKATSRDLDVIRRAFERAARHGGDDLLARIAAPGGARVLCAWCGTVRTSADRWLPIAEHLPPEDTVTHGICPPCGRRLHAELERESARPVRAN